MIGLAGTKKMDFTKFDEDTALNSQISSKMSKSIPESSILIHDKPEIIENKIRAAYCPPKDIQNNSIIELARYVLFPWRGSVNIERPAKYGGPVTYTNISELESDYRNGKIHPADLKGAIASSLIQILAPVRNEFDKHPELLNKVEQMQITR
jgi:tyrosyl-tRNA synthetase